MHMLKTCKTYKHMHPLSQVLCPATEASPSGPAVAFQHAAGARSVLECILPEQLAAHAGVAQLKLDPSMHGAMQFLVSCCFEERCVLRSRAYSVGRASHPTVARGARGEHLLATQDTLLLEALAGCRDIPGLMFSPNGWPRPLGVQPLPSLRAALAHKIDLCHKGQREHGFGGTILNCHIHAVELAGPGRYVETCGGPCYRPDQNLPPHVHSGSNPGDKAGRSAEAGSKTELCYHIGAGPNTPHLVFVIDGHQYEIPMDYAGVWWGDEHTVGTLMDAYKVLVKHGRLPGADASYTIQCKDFALHPGAVRERRSDPAAARASKLVALQSYADRLEQICRACAAGAAASGVPLAVATPPSIDPSLPHWLKVALAPEADQKFIDWLCWLLAVVSSITEPGHLTCMSDLQTRAKQEGFSALQSLFKRFDVPGGPFTVFSVEQAFLAEQINTSLGTWVSLLAQLKQCCPHPAPPQTNTQQGELPPLRVTKALSSICDILFDQAPASLPFICSRLPVLLDHLRDGVSLTQQRLAEAREHDSHLLENRAAVTSCLRAMQPLDHPSNLHQPLKGKLRLAASLPFPHSPPYLTPICLRDSSAIILHLSMIPMIPLRPLPLRVSKISCTILGSGQAAALQRPSQLSLPCTMAGSPTLPSPKSPSPNCRCCPLRSSFTNTVTLNTFWAQSRRKH